MVGWKITIYAERCTGCRICQMICSWANEKMFQPSNAYIQVKGEEPKFTITLDSRCTRCGLCASYCASQALVKEKEVPANV